jgi:hypothetical protein
MPDPKATAAATGAEPAPKPGTDRPATVQKPAIAPVMPPEFGGPAGPEPTRYGDWERNGRVSDF